MLLRNAEKSFSQRELLRVNYTYKQHYFDFRTNREQFYRGKEDFEDLLNSLSLEEKKAIRFIAGHDLSYGLHTHFPQESRYLLLVREPIARTLSLYNYERSRFDFLMSQKTLDAWHKQLLNLSETYFFIDGKIPSFEEWLECSYGSRYPFHFTMTKFLQHFGFLDSNVQKDSWDRLFEKFFFVGLTETLDEDKLFLYAQTGIHYFWSDKNASKPYVTFGSLPYSVQEKVREKNREDFELYERAKQEHRSLKKKHPNFDSTVKKMRFWEICSFPKEKSVSTARSIYRFFRNYWTE